MIALIIPYILAWIPKQKSPFGNLPVKPQDVNAWIIEIDPAATVGGGGGSSASTEFYEQELNFIVEIKDSRSKELVPHLFTKVKESIEGDSWIIVQSGTSDDQFSMVLVKGHMRYRVYAWSVPASKVDREQAEAKGQKAVRLKIVILGYNTPAKG